MMIILCTALGHRRDHRRVWYDGIDYRTTCTRCSTPLIKDERGDRWRIFDRERDYNVARAGKPLR